MDEHGTRFATNLGQVLADMASKVSSQALSSDPNLRARLLALDGRTVEIQCTTPNLSWQVHILDGGVHTTTTGTQSAHVIVRGGIGELVSWLRPGKPGRHLEVTGDDTLLLELTDIFKNFRPDIEDPLSNFIGREAAANIIGTAEMGLQGLRRLFDNFSESAQHQAAGRFVNNTQFDEILSGVDKLRLRVDRLAAKIAAKEQSREHAK